MGAAAPCTHARAYTSLCARNARGFGPRTCMRRPLPLHSRGSQTECSVSTARGTTNTTKKCCCCALSRARKPSWVGGPILVSYLLASLGTLHPTPMTPKLASRKATKVQKGPRMGTFGEQQATQKDIIRATRPPFFRSKSSRWYRVRLRWRPRRVWAWASCSPKTLPAATTRRRGVAPTG